MTAKTQLPLCDAPERTPERVAVASGIDREPLAALLTEMQASVFRFANSPDESVADSGRVLGYWFYRLLGLANGGKS